MTPASSVKTAKHPRRLLGIEAGLLVAKALKSVEQGANRLFKLERLGGRLHVQGDTDEQGIAEIAAKPRQRLAQRRLLRMQRLGGARQAAFAEQHVEDPKRVQVEIFSVLSRSGFHISSGDSLTAPLAVTLAARAGGGQRKGADMKSFIFEASPGRVVFGPNAVDHLPREIEQLGARRALVLSTPQQVELATDIAGRLGERSVRRLSACRDACAGRGRQKAIEEASRLGADCVVAAGGGSTIGLAKAIALNSALPILAVPTTYAGSEMTPIYGLTEAGLKRTGRDRRVLPRTVIYDPLLTLDLPSRMSIASGFNAIAHAAEALYAENANPVTSLMAEEGIRALTRGLPGV